MKTTSERDKAPNLYRLAHPGTDRIAAKPCDEVPCKLFTLLHRDRPGQWLTAFAPSSDSMPLESLINLSHVMGIEQCAWRCPFLEPLSVFLVEIPAAPTGLPLSISTSNFFRINGKSAPFDLFVLQSKTTSSSLRRKCSVETLPPSTSGFCTEFLVEIEVDIRQDIGTRTNQLMLVHHLLDQLSEEEHSAVSSSVK